MGKTNNEVNAELGGALVPLYLRITLWMSRALGAAPLQLRRTRTGWLLSVSSRLVTLQRLAVVITNIGMLSAIALDLVSDKSHRVRVGVTSLSVGVHTAETLVIMIGYSVGILTAPRQLGRTFCVLQQIHEIKNSQKGRKQLEHTRSSKTKHVFLILYLTWQIITYFIIYPLTYYPTLHKNATIYGYPTIVLVLLQLHWSMILVEINTTLTFLNDELDILFKRVKEAGSLYFKTNPENKGNASEKDTTTAGKLRFENKTIHRLSLSYDAICEMLVQVDKNNGPFLLCTFFILFMHLLITPYNLIAVILCIKCKNEEQQYFSMAIQLNWSLLHFTHLVIFVEPCHWLQEQRERTSRLLNNLVCQADRCHLDRTHLDPFLLQTQLYDCTLAPCGVFTITRPLFASLVGGVTTYLIIMVQFQAITEEV